MSIAPLEGFAVVRSDQSNYSTAGSGYSPASSERVAKPVTGNVPKQESATPKSIPSNYDLPEDVVEVHQDPEIKGQIIVQYLDPTGGVILQVPSTEELSVERGIAQEFQKAAKLSATLSGAYPEKRER
jgi:hypothetical protein